MLFVVPGDVLRPDRPDEHFAPEVQAARDAGHEVALVDHDAAGADGGAGRSVSQVPGSTTFRAAVYRGWMLRSEQYTAFSQALAARGAVLRTDPAQYRQAHELPGWYDAVAEVTPRSVWTVGDGHDDFVEACARLGPGPAVLRDYTKSMKHYWHEAAFVPDAADPEASWTVASRFRQLRDEDFTGGFVLRRFEELTRAEARTWWVDGVCRLVGAHPDTPHDVPAAVDLEAVAPGVAAMRLPFVTVDLALRADGVWRVVEIGDGQVSDRPTTMSPADLVRALSDDAVRDEARSELRP